MYLHVFGKYILIATCLTFMFFSQQVETFGEVLDSSEDLKYFENLGDLKDLEDSDDVEDSDDLISVFDLASPNRGRRGYSHKSHKRGFHLGHHPPGHSKRKMSKIASVIKKVPKSHLNDVLSFKVKVHFSLFVPKHSNVASKLVKIFLDIPTVQELRTLAAYIRSKISPALFDYAYSVALMTRPDTEGIKFPNHIQLFPNHFISKEVLLEASKAPVLASTGQKAPVDIPFKNISHGIDAERILDYWREDMGINLHHWHWHLGYPTGGDMRVVNKDRRGELFYYMHAQAIARYNFERFSNNLKRVKELSDWYAPIEEEYYPNLQNYETNQPYANRSKNMILADVDTDDYKIKISDALLERNRVYSAVMSRSVRDRFRGVIRLDEVSGIDILSNIVEPSVLSPNPDFYGLLHASGHLLLASIHKPRSSGPTTVGVMSDTATAMRDPVFYRWHGFIDEIFQKFKESVPPYSIGQLNFPGIKVTDVNVKSHGEASKNVFFTYWRKTKIEINFELNPSDPPKWITVRYTHLDHREFSYEIVVENANRAIKKGVCRIYMSPAYDETGASWNFTAQRKMFIELDKFNVTLKPGRNIIPRKSIDSLVSVPVEESFYNSNAIAKDTDKNVIQGCGWPQNLLIPKGTEEGLASQLFVVISNYEEDKVKGSKHAHNECYCGVRGSKYPYKKSMGFPFDRPARRGVTTLKEFLTPNMFVQNCNIKHENKVVA